MPIMIQTELGKQQKKPKTFLANMFKRNKDEDDAYKGSLGVCPVSTSLSVHAALDLMPCSLASTLTLTPGRTRNLDQDMEALRLSRQDNPFLQLLASRESLLDSDDCNDAAILMSNEHLVNSLDLDPLSLPEIHEHMIRSPPPTTWPRSPNSRMFRFPGSDYEDDSSQESLVGQTRSSVKSPVLNEHSSPKRSRSVMDSSSDFAGPFSILNAPRRSTRDEEELLVGTAPPATMAPRSHQN